MAFPHDMPAWERRFRAPTVTFPEWARLRPERLVFASTETGVAQVCAMDLDTGWRRQVTDVAIGVGGGRITPDGSQVVWFDDRTGDEVGQWRAQPFEGGPVTALVDAVPDGWSTGLALDDGVVVLGTAAADGYTVWRSSGGGPAEVLHRHPELVEVEALSRDGRLVCLSHAEHGDNVHLALRVVEVASGAVAGDLWDGAGLGLSAAGWSPVAGDPRLAVVGERSGWLRPGLWDLATGARRDLDVGEVAGDLTVAGWWPDGSALLLVHAFEGRDQLLRHDLSSGATVPVEHRAGSVLGARVRPDSRVWYLLSRGSEAPSVLTTGASKDEVVLAPAGEAAPRGYPYRSWHFANASGQTVHGFVVTPPAGDGPHPLIMLVHGGPAWLWADAWRPEVPTWVDHGFAVALVNYRGSTGYGVAWRDALLGRPGFTELEDVVAGVDDLVASGLADPARVVLSGGSWGGYLTLLGLGREPDRWVAGVAAVPVADYPSAYADEAPTLQAYDRTLFGGSPEERPDLYRERSPLTYAASVRAPVLVMAGDNDSRCPIGQVLNYVEALSALGKEVEVYRYDAGHGSMVVDERVRQMRVELDFVLRRVRAAAAAAVG
jgi:dipeptidyl aminopeptidase/acylaminoacyl peptidase